MATTLRELLIKIGVDADTQKLAKFEKSVERAKHSLTAIAKAAAFVGVAIGGATAKIVTSYATQADAAAKNARAVGITTEAYQELEYAADQSGVTGEQLLAVLPKLAAKTSDAARGNKELIKTYKELNLDARALHKLSPDQQFEAIAEAVSKLDSAGDRTRITMKLFEEVGPKFATMFSSGAKGIAELRKQARALGFVISDEDAQKAEAFNDQMARLKRLAMGLRNTVAISLVPKLTELASKVESWAIANKEVINSKIEKWLEKAERGAKKLYAWIKKLGGGEFDKGLERIAQGIATIVGVFAASKAVTAFVSILGVVKSTLVLLGSVGVVALAKIIALVVAATAYWGTLLLIVDDVITYFRGGDSLLGRIIANVQAGNGGLGKMYKRIQAMFAALGKGERIVDKVFRLFSTALTTIRKAFIFMGRVARDVFSLFERVATAVFEKLKARALPILETIGSIGRDVFTLLRNLLLLLWERAGKPALEAIIAAFTALWVKIGEGIAQLTTKWGPTFKVMQSVVESVIGVMEKAIDKFFDKIELGVNMVKKKWDELKDLPLVSNLFDEDFDPKAPGASGVRPPSSVVTRDMRTRAQASNVRTSNTSVGISAPISIDARGMRPGQLRREVSRGVGDAGATFKDRGGQ